MKMKYEIILLISLVFICTILVLNLKPDWDCNRLGKDYDIPTGCIPVIKESR